MTRVPPHDAAARFFLPWLVLAVTLGVTWFTWTHERQTSQQALRSQFDFALRESVSRVEQRIVGYEQMLRGVQSLFATTSFKNRAALHGYVDTLQLGANFSGVQNIGLVEWVPAQRRAEHVATMRQAGFPNYALIPDDLRESYAPVIQRESYVGRYFVPLGRDVWVEPVLRLALEKARDSGMAAISSKIEWRSDAGMGVVSGFAMCLPIYAQGQALGSVAQRRAHLIGWVYATFRMSDFMASLYGSQPPGLTLAMYDGADTKDSALLYDSNASAVAGKPPGLAAISAHEYMVVAGHNWTLSLNTQDSFEERYGKGAGTVIAVAGVGLSLLLALLTWLMINGRDRALRLAAAMTEELRHMAQHDPLTGLPNRALFNDRLNQELARAKRQGGRFAMVFLDLDHFKPINDNFGHDVGDQVLRQVARQLLASVRATDTVARIGGDEFVVLLAQLSEADTVLALANKLHQTLKQPFMVNGHNLSISSCIGVAVYPEDGTDASALTKGADDAMYRAKAAGRDGVRLCSHDR